VADHIGNYLAVLRSELSFDPALADRICAEVKEHLIDIADAEGRGESAEQRAVARMGDARRLAADMARVAMPERMKLTWRTVALSALAVFLAMRLRNVLVPVDGTGIDAAEIALAVDRFAYWGALFVGIAGWLLTRSSRAMLGTIRTVMPIYLCGGALTVSCAAGSYLIASMLAADGWSASMTIPLLAAAAEAAILGLFFWELRALARHARRVTGPEAIDGPVLP
jgi:hypothetical protein